MIDVCERCLSADIEWNVKKFLFWSRFYYVCQNCGRISTKTIQIDDLCYDAIYQLNKLGYKTSYCCEGHFGYNLFMPYIAFKPRHFPKEFEKENILKTVGHLTSELLYSTLEGGEQTISFLPPDVVKESRSSFNRWKLDLWENITMYVFKLKPRGTYDGEET